MQALPPETASFNGLDWLLILLLVFSTVTAFLRGFIRALFSLAALVISLVVASRNYVTLAMQLHRTILSFAGAEVVSFLLILILITVLLSVMANLLRKAVSAIGLGLVDRLLGAVFGFFRGCLFGTAVLMALAAWMPRSPWVEGSRLAPYFLSGAHAVFFVVPGDLAGQMSAGAAHLLHAAPREMRPHTLAQPPP